MFSIYSTKEKVQSFDVRNADDAENLKCLMLEALATYEAILAELDRLESDEVDAVLDEFEVVL